MAITFGKVPKPPILEMICDKPYDGAGFTRVSPRVIVGTCEHITAGGGSIEFYQKFFSTGGERALDALVDFVVGTDGRIGMLNDPWGTRMPWANGGSDGLEGDGPAFVATFGVYGINANLASIEHVGDGTTPWPDVQWKSSVALTAWLFDQAKVAWDSYPVNQNYGVVTHMLHFEFATKPCPGPYLRDNIDRYQADVRAILKQHQAVDAPAPVPTPEPPKPEPVSIYPKGMTEKKAIQYFGKMRDHTATPVKERGFNAKGAISLAWLERGAKEKAYPEARDRYRVEHTPGDVVLELVTFGNGWLLLRRGDRGGWEWAS
jgi:hypothetical protein